MSREFRESKIIFFLLLSLASSKRRESMASREKFKNFHEIIKKGKSNDALNLSISDLYRLLQHEMVARAFTKKCLNEKSRRLQQRTTKF